MSRILVVEDEEIVRSNIVQILDASEYEIEEAENGIEAIQKLDAFFPDLILSDIMMPGMDGYELVKRIQTNPLTANIPIILLTARTERQDIRRGMEFGADDYITKPFKAVDLISAVKTRLKKKENFERRFEELKSNIALYIPHELRTPLVSIIGFADLLTTSLDDLEQDEIKEMASKVKSSSLRLYDRIEKFIYFSELETSRDDVDISTVFNVEEAHITSRLRTKFKNKDTDGIHVNIDGAKVLLSEEFFLRILFELVDNAFKFTGKTPLIKVIGKKENDIYNLIVEDNGHGMSPDEINHTEVFRQFNKEERQQEGNGLGLAIVKNILRMVDGQIRIESDNESYTRVIVQLRTPSSS